MSPYLILALTITAVIAVIWLIAVVIENKSNRANGGWYVLAWSLTFFILFVGGSIGSSEIAEHQYRDRIQEKYNINVITSFTDDEYDYAVYADGNCVARKAPNDVLHQLGCVTGKLREVGE